MNRLRAKAGSAALAALAAVTFFASSTVCVRAQTPLSGVPNYWFAGTRLAFERPQLRAGGLAVATSDSGLGRFLTKAGATLAYQPGQSYVVITTGDRRTITFAVGDTHYEVGGVSETAPFAPYAVRGDAYLPFLELARALYVIPVDDGDAATTVLEPQLGELDVHPSGRAIVATFRGAVPLHFKRLSGDADDHLTIAFTGIATTLERERAYGGALLQGVTLTVIGTPRNPTTVVDFRTVPGAARVLAPGDSPNAISVAFAAPGVALGGTPIPATGDATIAVAALGSRDGVPPYVARPSVNVPPAPPVPADVGAPAQIAPTTALAGNASAATVNDVHVDAADEGLSVAVGITGPVTYEWHRLPDDRWYVDLKPATLAMDAQNIPVQSSAVQSLRIKGFVGPSDHLPTVRIAMTLATPRIVNLLATADGLLIAVDRLDDLEPQKVGMGELADGKLVASIVPLPTVAGPPPDDGGLPPDLSGWKFGASHVPVNPRLIVIDPGHGGSDRGAAHNELTEAMLNLDISKRLRALLVARGWVVKLTRDSDVDVYEPNDSAHDELQARCDVANNAGARLFISVHTNSFTTSGLNGTTTYYYKSDSYALANAIHARLAAELPTQDDGVRKENFYVIHHTDAPAVLIETAFLSNASDARLLKSDEFLQSIASSIASGVGDYASPSSPLSSSGGPSASDGN